MSSTIASFCFAIATMFVTTLSLANDMRHVPPADLDEIYIQLHKGNMVQNMEELSFKIPLWDHDSRVSYDWSGLAGHAVVRLKMQPRRYEKEALLSEVSLEDFHITLSASDGRRTTLQVPTEWKNLAVAPQIWATKLYGEINNKTGKTNGITVAVPFGRDDDLMACYELLEEKDALTQYQADRVYTDYTTDNAADPLLQAELRIDGTHNFSIWYPKECEKIFGVATP